MTKKQCNQCSKTFPILVEDTAMYTQFSVPEPTLCPDCRNQRRLAFRNERVLYRRNCDKCNVNMVSVYPGDSTYTVYCATCWWGDDWDPLSFGMQYGSKRSFFEQFGELLKSVPRVGLVGSHNENSEYVNYANYMKDCYLIYGANDAENSLYTWRIYHSRDCVDCVHITKSELCYYAIDVEEAYNSHYIFKSKGVTDSAFLFDCQSVRNCFLSTNLRTAEYVFKNKQLTKSEYERAIQDYDLGSYEKSQKGWNEFKELFQKKAVHRSIDSVNSEDVTGNDFVNCHNCYYAFAMKDSENTRYTYYGEALKDSMDTVLSGWPGERIYETMSGGIGCYNVKFCAVCWTCTNTEYSDNCHNSDNLFGSAGIKKGKYTILNVQYTEAKFTLLRDKIVNDMKQRGEYGEFFPYNLSPFSYNETLANDFYPLTQETVQQRGWKWQENLPSTTGDTTVQELPDHISDVPDSIIKEVIQCTDCKRNYKIIQQELAFYRQVGITLPRQCSNCRLNERMSIRNPMYLWQRQCMCTRPPRFAGDAGAAQTSHGHPGRCPNTFETTYDPSGLEIVYCGQCYQKEIY